jgi:hypothetical protein
MGQLPGLAGDKVIYNFFNNNEELPVDIVNQNSSFSDSNSHPTVPLLPHQRKMDLA